MYPWRLSTWHGNIASFPAATVMFGTCSRKWGSQLRIFLPEALKLNIYLMNQVTYKKLSLDVTIKRIKTN